MNRLSPEAQRLFQLARHVDDPDAAQVNRVNRALAHRLATGGGLALSATLLSVSARAGATLSVTKIVTAVVVVGAVSTAGFFGLHSRKQPMANATHIVNISISATSVRAPASATAPRAEPMASAPISSAPMDLSRSAPSRISARATPSVVVDEAADQLRAETAELHQAQTALRAGDTALALRLLNEQDTQYRSGLLQQERSAARVLALCQSGNVTSARAESARFDKRWPNSPLAGRVRAACK